MPTTWSPTASDGSFEAITRPTPPARITSQSLTGGTYDFPSFIQPRIAGSSDIYNTLTRTSPGPGSSTVEVVNSKSLRLTMPTGRESSLTCRFWSVDITVSLQKDSMAH